MAGGVRTNKSGNPVIRASELLTLATAEIIKKKTTQKQTAADSGRGEREGKEEAAGFAHFFSLFYAGICNLDWCDFIICHRFHGFEIRKQKHTAEQNHQTSQQGHDVARTRAGWDPQTPGLPGMHADHVAKGSSHWSSVNQSINQGPSVMDCLK